MFARTLSAFAVAALTVAAAGTAASAQDIETRSVVVHFGDLNLDSASAAPGSTTGSRSPRATSAIPAPAT